MRFFLFGGSFLTRTFSVAFVSTFIAYSRPSSRPPFLATRNTLPNEPCPSILSNSKSSCDTRLPVSSIKFTFVISISCLHGDAPRRNTGADSARMCVRARVVCVSLFLYQIVKYKKKERELKTLDALFNRCFCVCCSPTIFVGFCFAQDTVCLFRRLQVVADI